MVLFDTSAWIQFFRTKNLGNNDEKINIVATCPPVIQEVLQGLRYTPESEIVERGMLSLPCLESEVSLDMFVEAAEIYRHGRRKGITIRSSIDCLVSAIAIHHDILVVHNDRDFSQIEKFTTLQTQIFLEFFKN